MFYTFTGTPLPPHTCFQPFMGTRDEAEATRARYPENNRPDIRLATTEEIEDHILYLRRQVECWNSAYQNAPWKMGQTYLARREAARASLSHILNRIDAYNDHIIHDAREAEYD